MSFLDDEHSSNRIRFMAKRLIPFNICQWFFQPGQRSICFTQNCGHLLRQPENDVNSACTRSYKYILR